MTSGVAKKLKKKKKNRTGTSPAVFAGLAFSDPLGEEGGCTVGEEQMGQVVGK